MGNDLNKRLHLPHVCTLMGQDVLPSNPYLKLLSRNHSQQVAISDRQARLFLQSTGQECSAVIPFGLDASLKVELLPDTVRDIDVLGVGGLIQLKNYTAFVDAIASVRDQYPGVKAVLIGAGEEQKMLEAKIASLSLSGNLTLIPGLPRIQVLEYMLRSRYFFHPSRYESLGYVFLEAMSRGMEIISLPVGAAFHHARWSMETDTQGMTRVLLAKMGQSFTPEMVWMGSVDDTVSAYEQMYDELLQS
jgi:glycosyltransferase involved in cell wall biosynthesis